MLFNFVLYNHSAAGQRSLEDVIGIMGHQLRALGHQAIWVPGKADFIAPRDGVNVLVEGFTEPIIKDIARCHAEGARFICLATEEPTEKGFNHGIQKEMAERQRVFPRVAPYLEGILHLVPGTAVTTWYGRHAPSAAVELGYAPTLVGKANSAPTWDVGFYGSLSKRRLAILKTAAKKLGGPGCRIAGTKDGDGIVAYTATGQTRNVIRIVQDFAPQAQRDAIMRDCGISVQIRKFEQMGLVSNCRLAMSIGVLGLPVVAEPHLLSGEWADIVQFSKSLDAFYGDLITATRLRSAIHAGQLARMKEKMTPERCIGRALHEIGLAERLSAAA